MSKPSALVFDFDGMLIDTEVIESASPAALWQKYGRVLPYEGLRKQAPMILPAYEPIAASTLARCGPKGDPR